MKLPWWLEQRPAPCRVCLERDHVSWVIANETMTLTRVSMEDDPVRSEKIARYMKVGSPHGCATCWSISVAVRLNLVVFLFKLGVLSDKGDR